jgi:hypothetical protein
MLGTSFNDPVKIVTSDKHICNCIGRVPTFSLFLKKKVVRAGEGTRDLLVFVYFLIALPLRVQL